MITTVVNAHRRSVFRSWSEGCANNRACGNTAGTVAGTGGGGVGAGGGTVVVVGGTVVVGGMTCAGTGFGVVVVVVVGGGGGGGRCVVVGGGGGVVVVGGAGVARQPAISVVPAADQSANWIAGAEPSSEISYNRLCPNTSSAMAYITWPDNTTDP